MRIEDEEAVERERKRSRERERERKNEWVLKRDGDPVPAGYADLFVPFSRRNERRTNEIPRSIIDTEPGVGTGRARVLCSQTCEHEIGALTSDFALNAYSGHVSVRINKKSDSLNLAIQNDSFANAYFAERHAILKILSDIPNYYIITVFSIAVICEIKEMKLKIVTVTEMYFYDRFDINRNYFVPRNSEFLNRFSSRNR